MIEDKEDPQFVYITKDCSVAEADGKIVVTEPSGATHEFPSGSIVFSDINNLKTWSE